MSLLPGKLTEHGTKVTFAINDLPDTITSTVRLFADDTALYLTIEGENNSTNLQHDLDKLPVWERNLDMEFNPSKCQVIQVTGSRSRKPVSANYCLHGQILETGTCAKYLGIDISSDLSWRSHIDRITGKATKTLILSVEISRPNTLA